MLRSIKSLFNYSIEARDGDIGKVINFYFDDELWIIRYLVVDTGGWLSGKKVLISPEAFYGEPDWVKREFPVNLTKEMVEHSPGVDSEKPVSREMEIELLKYFNWPAYWQWQSSPMEPTPMAIGPRPGKRPTRREEDVASESHLRSIKEVNKYYIEAKDGDIGHVEDFIVDDNLWNIRYMVVDTRNWLPGRKVLIAPYWIQDVKWVDTKVSVDLTQEEIKNSPPYDPEMPVNREYEEILYDYYGRPKYWI